MRTQIKITLLIIVFVNAFSLLSENKKREMRAAWIATVANIDWPSKKTLTPAEQRKEMINMLDGLSKTNINAIIVQIRPTADAFFPSTLEPWSQFLTNKVGQRPNPYYDPLQFIIDEAHKRCIEVHVWLNPYRVSNVENEDFNDVAYNFYNQTKNLFVKYGGKYYYDPGYDETRQFLNKVVKDIVERYDVQAIHFDDYFYPYRIDNQEFPDDVSFAKNPRGFSSSQKDDWRRNNVNMIIAELQQTIKSTKPWVEFGISPFGVWRNKANDPKGSNTEAGVQNYDDLYADILKWLKEGTIDYVVPQLYWEIGKKVADYKVLVKWWSENSYNKNLYIGLYASGLEVNKTEAWQKGNELVRQLKLNKDFKEIDGEVYFSAKTYLKNIRGLNDHLQKNDYKYPALCPVNRNLKTVAAIQPENMRVVKDRDDVYFMWNSVDGEGGNATAYYVVYAFKGRKVGDLNDPSNILIRTTSNTIHLNEIKKKMRGKYTFVVTSINKYKMESVPTFGITRRL